MPYCSTSSRAEIDLECYEGATFSQSFIWKSSDVEVNITNYTAKMQVRATIASANTIFDLTTENGGIVIANQTTDPGKYTIVIPSSDTADTTNHVEIEAVYDLQLISPAPESATRLQQFGVFRIYPSVTRS